MKVKAFVFPVLSRVNSHSSSPGACSTWGFVLYANVGPEFLLPEQPQFVSELCVGEELH